MSTLAPVIRLRPAEAVVPPGRADPWADHRADDWARLQQLRAERDRLRGGASRGRRPGP